MKQVNDEKKMIEMITGMFPKSKQRLNKCFESDAEILAFGDKKLLFTIDEFSSEDMFRDSDPYSLGWNVAAGGISDISACAGIPLFYGHAMVVSTAWNKDYIKKFTQGIADVLKEIDTAFIGGDFGKAKDWHYTAAVIGKAGNKLLSRKGAAVGDGIYLSGKIGLGNLEAALKFYSHDKRLKIASNIFKCRFPLRLKESAFVSEYATCCTDTSDGVFNSLNILSEINGIGYEIKDLPYVDIGSFGAVVMSLPKELLLLGEAGEYELLFTVKPQREQVFLDRAKQEKFTFYKVGKVIDSAKVLVARDREIDLSSLRVRARDFDNRKEYLEYLVNYLKEQG
ncbi:MAG: thiamine-monophosphate kinase [Candidatus Omnitrophica bacterium]|nr:thiamine-monophosphate kinase [Candidatus Omnitrophota bacterium]MBU4467660.1 thiamine-monophosphate kinase [Candidatus Omnitrophota bacterium]MCG2707484.1 AIR synthase related protein [Candidatus Omnitrophota bacterium]